MKFLLDYVFPVTSIIPTPAASTAFLKQVCVVVKPKSGVDSGTFELCTSNAEIAALTDNVEAQQVLAGGLSRVYILAIDDLNLAEALSGHESDFYTLIFSSDFTDSEASADPVAASGTIEITSYADLLETSPDVYTVAGQTFTAQSGAATPGTAFFRAATSNNATAASLAAQINAHATSSALVVATVVNNLITITAKTAGASGNSIGMGYTNNGSNLGGLPSGSFLTGGAAGSDIGLFDGVLAKASTDDSWLETWVALEKHVGFHTTSSNKAKSMCYVFGKFLSGANWTNQQYISTPFTDDVDTLGEAQTLFDAGISFIISDDEYGKRLGLFAAGKKAIVAPYVTKNVLVRIQSRGLAYISGNQPNYSLTDAALLEVELQKEIDVFVERREIEAGTVDVKLEDDNFIASAYINMSEPKALWIVRGEVRQTL